jgi:cobalamin biosynthetic protein CobC
MSDDLLHGGGLAGVAARFPDAPGPWVDLSTGINPWPYPHTQLAASDLRDLPGEPLYQGARDAMVAAFGCRVETIALTPGSQAGLQLLPLIHRAPRVGVVSPTYSEHANAWGRAGSEVVPLNDPPSSAAGWDAVIVVNPNNPDGRVHARADLLALAGDLAARGGLLVVDEAFADADPVMSLAAHAGTPGLAILRSFGKFYGLAGLRLGAVLAAPRLARASTTRAGPWAVSGPALAIGARAYADRDWAAATRARLASAAADLDRALTRGGLVPAGGTTLFRWAKARDAHRVWERLARHGVYARRFAWSDDYLRFGLPASPAQQDRLVGALNGA